MDFIALIEYMQFTRCKQKMRNYRKNYIKEESEVQCPLIKVTTFTLEKSGNFNENPTF